MKGLLWNLESNWWQLPTPVRQAVRALVFPSTTPSGGGVPDAHASTPAIVRGVHANVREGGDVARRLCAQLGACKHMLTLAETRARALQFYDKHVRDVNDGQREMLAGLVLLVDPFGARFQGVPMQRADTVIRRALQSPSTTGAQLKLFDDTLRETLRCNSDAGDATVASVVAMVVR